MIGRLVLTKSIIGALTSYTMQSILLLAYTYIKIEKLQRFFLWGFDVETRKVHTIAWKKICLPKQLEGS